MRIPFFSVCLSVCEQNKNCSCAKNVVVTRVVQIFISFISLNRRRCSVEMMCLHIYRRRESISDFFFFLQKKNLWRFWQFIPRTHEPVFRVSSLFFYDQSSNVYKIWTMTQTRKEEILDGFDIFQLYKKKKLLMVQKSLWNNIPFLSFLRHENTKNIPLFFLKKVLFFLCFVVVCNTMTPTRRSFHPLGGGTCDVALDTLSALRSFLFSKYPPKNKAKQM